MMLQYSEIKGLLNNFAVKIEMANRVNSDFRRQPLNEQADLDFCCLKWPLYLNIFS